jgi:hypothetical protein
MYLKVIFSELRVKLGQKVSAQNLL